MPYTLPSDVDDRPIAIDGAGVLGRRIASVFAAGGSDVRVFDVSQAQRQVVLNGSANGARAGGADTSSVPVPTEFAERVLEEARQR